MGFLKDIKEIKKTLNNLTRSTYSKAQKYDDLSSRLEKIKIKVDKVGTVYDAQGNKQVKVNYSVGPLYVTIDEDGNLKADEMFVAINYLDLISFEDMAKIQKEIAKNSKKNGD